MTEREVKEVVTPVTASDGTGVRLRRSIATRTLDHLDPRATPRTRTAVDGQAQPRLGGGRVPLDGAHAA